MAHVDPVEPATDEESTLAYERTSYRYTDPVTDEAFPRVIEATDDLLDESPKAGATSRRGGPAGHRRRTGERDGRPS
ncbi:hypothetical protein BH18ACI1_BH18ACI1_18910 [soil metagenome]|jgi:hypothetical protein